MLPYTSGTTGAAQGLHAHAPQRDAQRWSAAASGIARTPDAVVPRRAAVVPRHRHAVQHARPDLRRARTIVLMPRWDRELAGRADPALPRHALDLHPDDGGRPARRARTTTSFDLSSLRAHQRRRRGDARGGRAAAAGRMSACTFVEGYGLTETMAATHINPPERAEAAVPGHPDLRRRLARRRSRRRSRSCRRARSARSSRAGRRSSRATGTTPRRRASASSSSTASASSAPATSAAWTRTATSSSPTGSSA